MPFESIVVVSTVVFAFVTFGTVLFITARRAH